MNEMASRLTKVREAVKILNFHLQNRNVSAREYFTGTEAIFELLDQPWDSDVDPVWLEGYEQCMVDIVDAIADEWGIVVWPEEEK